MIDPQWRFDARKQCYFSDVLNAAIPANDDSVQVVDWARWPRWFETAAGVGNSLRMWWPSRPGPYSARILCDRCGLPFILPTGFNFKSQRAKSSGRDVFRLEDVRWTGGPCSHCRLDGVVATGRPLLIVRNDAHGMTFITGAHPLPYEVVMSWAATTDDLREGKLTPTEVIGRLRSDRESFLELADWLDAHALPSAAVASIVEAIVQMVGPVLSRDGDIDAEAETAIRGVVKLVLDHFDRTRATGA